MSTETPVLPNPIVEPWHQSAKGSVYCMWGSLPSDSVQLKQAVKTGNYLNSSTAELFNNGIGVVERHSNGCTDEHTEQMTNGVSGG
jgi:hypothetical protein